MTPLGRLVIGTRGSPLALAQAETIVSALRRATPGLEVALQTISTEGDQVQTGSLPSWGRGVFVRDIERALLRGEIDLAVHSLKDLPADLPDGLVIAAVPRRADAADVLVTPDGRDLDSLPAGARVGTSSLRRAAFLRARRPDLQYVPVRGNVGTRWQKLLDPASDYDALVLAAAGLDRLGLVQALRVPIPTDVLLPAPGQGALAIEVRAGDTRAIAVAARLDHRPTAAAVRAERRLLADLDGGCRLPVAALATAGSGATITLRAAVASSDGARVLRHEATGSLEAPEALGRHVAAALLAAGAADLLRAVALVEVSA